FQAEDGIRDFHVTGVQRCALPISAVAELMVDPLPQALALTAIVITFALTTFLLALAFRSWVLLGHDEVQDDVEDRRVAVREAREIGRASCREREGVAEGRRAIGAR